MLRFLSIKRLAVIDSVEVEFGPGLNVLTGETGAGKSMLVEAVGLLLGGRASADLVRTGEDMAAIEAIFEAGNQELIVRREITSQGRSRAFIDGSLATAGALRETCASAIELHGQHEHQTLLDADTHLGVLDAFAGANADADRTAMAFDEMRRVSAELERARAASRDRQTRQELAAFQLAELDRVQPVAGEDEELTTLRRVLSSAERIERLCVESYAALYESDGAALSALGGVWKRLGELAAVEPQFQPYLDARDAIKSQLEDLASFLRRYAADIEASPERLQQVEERLASLERLKRKHGPELADVLATQGALRDELAALGSIDERIADLEVSLSAARSRFLEAATRLSAARRRAGSDLSRRLEALLAELAMERTRFEVRFAEPAGESGQESDWNRSGIDRAEFFVSPNPGEELRPLARVASGGELSRIMLAIKTLTAANRFGFSDRAMRPPSGGAPGLVFDEVDAGIGGRAADIVGRKLQALGSVFQVLCITHLPQIAACADTHFRIEKAVQKGRTVTSVARLDRAGRVEELGRMLGGASVSDTVRASAREMLDSRTPPLPGVGAKGESERAKAKRTQARRPS